MRKNEKRAVSKPWLLCKERASSRLTWVAGRARDKRPPMSRPFDELLLPGSLRDGVQASAPDAAKWLNGASSREVLHQLTHGDPLGIEARAALRLRDRALLIARERIVMRALAQVAFHSKAYRDWQPMDIWLRVHIDRSIDALLERDREEERAGVPALGNDAWAFLTNALGIPPQRARRAAVAFNDLPAVVRRVFWRTIVEGVSEARCVADGMGTLAQIKSRVERGLRTLSFGRDPGGPDPHELEAPRG
jgi:hypothetical protein